LSNQISTKFLLKGKTPLTGVTKLKEKRRIAAGRVRKMLSGRPFSHAIIALIGILLLSVAPERKRWKRTFEVGEDRNGKPSEFIGGASNHQSTECSQGFINSVAYDRLSDEISKRGSRSHEAGVNTLMKQPCATNEEFTLRHYPTWDGSFKLPVLVMFWMYVDAPDWESMTGNRFSQLTTKGKLPKEDQILTTHVLRDGTMDIGHAIMSFQSRDVTAPLRTWNLQSLYIENVDGKTQATLWSDRDLVAQATCKATWDPPELKHWHMGLYGDNNSVANNTYPNVPFRMFNDDIQVIEVGGYDEALQLIEVELGDGIVDSTPPAPPTTVKVSVHR
jgi:hypothetical protein